MAIQFYNTYSKRKENFTPLHQGEVRMYNCGPTVYDYAHIGNFRSFLLADLLRRYLTYRGFEVRQVMNITDVGHMTLDDLESLSQASESEDKMVRAMRQTGIRDIHKLAEFFTQAFLQDAAALNCLEPFKRPKASEHVPEMIALIERLLANGYAYEEQGFVYYDVQAFKNYGKLSGNTIADLVAGHRIEIDPHKRHPADFALWKCDPQHLMKWPSPWSEGFPGWHIECSAMAMKYLGNTLDIHTGGEDNIFPHHEAEIAQSEGATGEQFCRYWIHARHLLVDGRKMSKSKGNFFTVRELMERGYQGREIRYVLLSSHYRQNMNFITGLPPTASREDYQGIQQLEALEEAKRTLKRLQDFVTALEFTKGDACNPSVTSLLAQSRAAFEKALDDDLNISGALSAVFEMVREINKKREQGPFGAQDAQQALATLRSFDQVLGLLPAEEQQVPAALSALIEKRAQARKAKDFATADKLREEARKLGFLLEDTPQGTIWKKIDS